MAKKVYDIVPPHAKPAKMPSKAHVVGKVKRPVVRKAPVRKETPRSEWVFPWKTAAVGGAAVALLAVGWIAVAKLPRADITIWPKTQTLSLQQAMTADKAAAQIDAGRGIIPARLIEEEQEGWQEFEATGTASSSTKATGSITIYNKITPAAPFALKAGTHFLSDSGKYFVTLAKVTIPAMAGKKPGAITVTVQAQDPGPDYNIGAAKFSIPKLAGTPYYHTLWAESSASMTGGSSSNFKKVTQGDIDNAKSQLTQKLLNQAEQLLRKKVASGEILLDGAILPAVESASTDVKADAAVGKFTEVAKVKLSALVFKESDAREFATHALGAQLPGGQSLRPETISIQYTPNLIDVLRGTERLNLALSATAYHTIDTAAAKGLVAQKSAAQIEDTIGRAYEGKLDKIAIRLWPFWVKKAPANPNRVKVNLEFE